MNKRTSKKMAKLAKTMDHLLIVDENSNKARNLVYVSRKRRLIKIYHQNGRGVQGIKAAVKYASGHMKVRTMKSKV